MYTTHIPLLMATSTIEKDAGILLRGANVQNFIMCLIIF